MLLESYSWPGNVRELKNIVERAVLLNSGAVIGTEHLPMEKLSRPAPPPPPGTPPPLLDAYKLGAATPRQVDAGRVDVPSPVRAARGATNAAERERIIAALNACAGNQSRAAKLLGIPRRTFLTKLDGYGIPRPKKGTARRRPRRLVSQVASGPRAAVACSASGSRHAVGTREYARPPPSSNSDVRERARPRRSARGVGIRLEAAR